MSKVCSSFQIARFSIGYGARLDVLFLDSSLRQWNAFFRILLRDESRD